MRNCNVILLPKTSNHILIACSSCSLYTFESDTDKESCLKKKLGFYNETILIYHKPNTTVILHFLLIVKSFVPQSGKLCTLT